MSDVYSGPVKIVTLSWYVPDDACDDCDPGHKSVDDGGTYLTVRVPTQAFAAHMRLQATLTITDPTLAEQVSR